MVTYKMSFSKNRKKKNMHLKHVEFFHVEVHIVSTLI